MITDHAADVYSVVSHRDRPFTFISCSRDTTVRVWELQGVFSLLRLAATWDCGFRRLVDSDTNEFSVLRTLGYRSTREDSWPVEKEMEESSPIQAKDFHHSLKPALCGDRSFTLNSVIESFRWKRSQEESKDSSTMTKTNRPQMDSWTAAQRFYRIYSFFSGGNGSMDVWEGVIALLQKKIVDGAECCPMLRSIKQRIVFNEDEVVARAKADTLKIENTKPGFRRGEFSGTADDQLRQAAMLHIRTGDFEKYCTTMIELGEWTLAISVAPAVSMEFWQNLSARYAQHLTMSSSEQSVPFLLSVGNSSAAVDFYLKRQDFNNAMIVAKLSQDRKKTPSPKSNLDDYLPDENFTSGIELCFDDQISSAGNALSDIILSDVTDSNSLNSKSVEIVGNVATIQAKKELKSTRPFIAASHYLSVNRPDMAVDVLSAAGEHDLAYSVAFCFGICTDGHVITLAESFAEHHGLCLGLEILESVTDSEIEKGLLVSKYCGDNGLARQLSAQFAVRPMLYWKNRAIEEETIGSDVDALYCCVIARDYAKAVAIGLSVLKRSIREPLDLTPTCRKILRGLMSIRAEDLDETLKSTFLCHLLWFAAHDAAELNLWETSWNILRFDFEFSRNFSVYSFCRRILHENPSKGNFPVAEIDIIYQV